MCPSTDSATSPGQPIAASSVRADRRRSCGAQCVTGRRARSSSGRGWFGYQSGAECTAAEAAGTRSHRAAYMIAMACAKLYDPPTEEDLFLDAAEARRR